MWKFGICCELSRNSFLGDIKYTQQYDRRYPSTVDEYRHCNQCLFNGYGKKRSADEKRQNHYELLNTRIFIPLSRMELSVRDPNNYQDELKLSYGISQLQDLSDYAPAMEHIDHDIPKDVSRPEQLEEQVKRLNVDLDDYFGNQIRNIVAELLRSQFRDIKIIETGEELPYYTISFYGLIPKLIRFWINGVDFSVSCKDGLCRLNNYIDFASIPALSESRLINIITELKNNPNIGESIGQFRERRRIILEQSNILAHSINKKIIFEIEHQRYKTRCKDCKKYSKWF